MFLLHVEALVAVAERVKNLYPGLSFTTVGTQWSAKVVVIPHDGWVFPRRMILYLPNKES